jgi:peptidyl-prolyl cis-trans isomerase C
LKTNAVKWIIAGLLLVVSFGCAHKEEGEPLARVGDYVITDQTLQNRIQGLPPFMQQQIATPEGRQRFLKALVEEEVIVREAEKMGLDKSPEFKRDMEQRRRDRLVRAFYDDVILAEAAPPDSTVLAYYEAHTSDYSIPEYAIARIIVVGTKNKALDLRKQIEAGADFQKLAGTYSLDSETKARGGLLPGRVERGVPIANFGDVPGLTDTILGLAVGEVSEPVKTDLGYALVTVDQHSPASVKPFDEVKKDIAAVLTNTRREGVRDRILADLEAKYDVVYLSESESGANSPEELFKKASEETDPQKKIADYRKFIETYPDNDRAYEAKFMVGFTQAEELKDYDQAEKTFKEFLDQYPENDLTDDAHWMLENMRSGAQPDFAPE